MKKSKNNWKQNNNILSLFLLENKNQIQKKKNQRKRKRMSKQKCQLQKLTGKLIPTNILHK